LIVGSNKKSWLLLGELEDIRKGVKEVRNPAQPAQQDRNFSREECKKIEKIKKNPLMRQK